MIAAYYLAVVTALFFVFAGLKLAEVDGWKPEPATTGTKAWSAIIYFVLAVLGLILLTRG